MWTAVPQTGAERQTKKREHTLLITVERGALFKDLNEEGSLTVYICKIPTGGVPGWYSTVL
jgi:hypothetical protein